jgi:hypothetical protein
MLGGMTDGRIPSTVPVWWPGSGNPPFFTASTEVEVCRNLARDVHEAANLLPLGHDHLYYDYSSSLDT